MNWLYRGFAVWALAAAAVAQSVEYKYTLVFDSLNGSYVAYHAPTIDPSGRVIVGASSTSPTVVDALIRGDGTTQEVIATTTGPIASFDTSQPIQARVSGEVVFTVALDSGERATMLYDGTTTVEVFRESLLPFAGAYLRTAVMNASGGFACIADFATIQGVGNQAVVLSRQSSIAIVAFAGDTSRFVEFSGLRLMNDDSIVISGRRWDRSLQYALTWIELGGLERGDYARPESISDVAWGASGIGDVLLTSSSGLWSGRLDSGLALIAGAGCPGAIAFFNPYFNINDRGNYVCEAALCPIGAGGYVVNQFMQFVAPVGSTLFGRTVLQTNTGWESINNRGQIAILVTLHDQATNADSVAIVRADPQKYRMR